MIAPTLPGFRTDGVRAGVRPATGATWVVGSAAGFAGAVALLLRLWLFEAGSPNNDEMVYLTQARALIHGHLLVPFSGNPAARQPWLFAIGHDGYIPKYLPVVAAVYAVGLLVFGSVIPVLVALSAAVPVLTYRLGRELGLTQGRAAAAAALFALSPAMLIEGGLVLSYLPFVVLMLGCWIAVFRAAARGRGLGWAGGAGLLAALAVCVRPMDGVLLLGPTLLWLVVRRADRVRTAAAVLAGGLPIVVLMLAYDGRVTGEEFRLPFSVLDPLDKLGFGGRRLFPEDYTHQYGLLQAVEGTVRHFEAEPAQWIFGFVAVVPLALLAARRGGNVDTRHRLLLCCSGLTLAAYFCFWGPWHASVYWGGTATLGPFYSLALIVPFMLVAFLAEVRTKVLVTMIGLAAIQPAAHAVDAFGDVIADHRTTMSIVALVDTATPTLVDADPPYLGHPVSGLWRPGTLLASRVPPAALPPGPWRLLALDGYPYGWRADYQLRTMRLSQGPVVRLRVRRSARGPGEILVVSRNGVTTACRQRFGITLTLTPSGVTGCAGEPVPKKWYRRPYRNCPDTSCLIISTFSRTDSARWLEGAWRRLPTDRVGTSVRLLTDGPVLRSHGSGWITVRAR